MTKTAFEEKIQQAYPHLPRNQRILAEYFLDNLDQVPFMSIHEIATEVQISVATVVRFTQKLGFTGFSEFRSGIKKSLQESLNQNIFPDIKDLSDNLIQSVANQDIKDINETLKLLDHHNFHEIVDWIMEADAVYTCGLGISHLLSQILAYQLTQVGIRARAFYKGSATFIEQLLYLSPKELLIAFSYPPYSRETIETAKYARQRELKVVAISNKATSPISFHAHKLLIVKSENLLYTNSLAANSVMINAIATECARRDKRRVEKILHGLDEANILQKEKRSKTSTGEIRK
jgi:DNA-binding MurR/RpiR family transcriptional regulator